MLPICEQKGRCTFLYHSPPAGILWSYNHPCILNIRFICIELQISLSVRAHHMQLKRHCPAKRLHLFLLHVKYTSLFFVHLTLAFRQLGLDWLACMPKPSFICLGLFQPPPLHAGFLQVRNKETVTLSHAKTKLTMVRVLCEKFPFLTPMSRVLKYEHRSTIDNPLL